MSHFPGWAPLLAVLALQAACATTSHEREQPAPRQGSSGRYAQFGHANGKPVSRRMELGTMKHHVAFACVRREVIKLFPDNVSIEPRYGLDPVARRYALTREWRGSLKPDVVLHAARSPDKVQCVYDFKFPCSAAHKSDPLGTAGVSAQLTRYRELGGHCPPGLVTPQLGINRE